MQNNIVAPYLIRAYVWQLLQANLGLNDTMYDVDGNGRGLVPIVPLGEEPELEQFNKPYLVYGFAESPSRNARLTTGNIMFAIYSTSFAEMTTVANVIGTAFEEDDSATNVNEFTSTIEPFVGIRFTDVGVSNLAMGEPETTEGGRVSVVLNIRYEYVSTLEVVNSFASWNGTRYVKSS